MRKTRLFISGVVGFWLWLAGMTIKPDAVGWQFFSVELPRAYAADISGTITTDTSIDSDTTINPTLTVDSGTLTLNAALMGPVPYVPGVTVLTNNGAILNRHNYQRFIMDVVNNGSITNGTSPLDGALLHFGSGVTSSVVTNNGAITNYRTTFVYGVMENYGTVTDHNKFYVVGSFNNYSGGRMIYNKSTEMNGSFNNYSGGAVEMNGALIIEGTLNNEGAVNNNAGGVLTNNYGTVTNKAGGAITNNVGGIVDNLGELNNQIGGMITNYGTLKNSSTGNLTNSGTLANYSLIQNTALATLTNYGALTNYAGGIVDNTGTLTNKAGGVITNYGTFKGIVFNYGAVANHGTFNAGVQNYGTLNNTGTITGFYMQNFKTMTNSGTIDSMINGSQNAVGGVLTPSPGELTNSGSLLGVTNYGKITNTASGLIMQGENHILLINNGRIINNGSFTNDFDPSTGGPSGVPLQTASLVNNNSITNNASANFENKGGASLANNGAIYNYGYFTNIGTNAETGAPTTLTNSGAIYNYVGLTNSGGATFTSSGSLYNYGVFTNAVATSVDNSGALANQAGGVINNYGTLNNAANTGAIVNNGTMNNNNGATITNRGALENSGVFNNISGSSLANYGTLTNTSTGAFNNNGSLDNFAGGTISNYGTFNAGTLQNYGTVENYGTFDGTNSPNYGTFKNAGVLNRIQNWQTLINSGTVDYVLNGDQSNTAVTITNSGTLGRFSSWGAITNTATGVITNAAAGQTFNYGGTLINNGSIVNSGQFYNQKNFNTSLPGSLTNNGVITNNAGATFENSFGATLTSSGAIYNYGDFTNAFGSTLTVTGGTVYGPIVNNGTFNVSGGTFILPAADQRLSITNLSGSAAFRVAALTSTAPPVTVTTTAVGNHTLAISGGGSRSIGQAVKAVDLPGGSSATFSGDSDVGAFRYALARGSALSGSFDAEDYYFANTGQPSTLTKAAMGQTHSTMTFWYGEMNEIRKRMGELRMGNQSANDFWARTYAGRFTIRPTGADGYRQNMHGLEIGKDNSQNFAGGKRYTGFLIGYGKADNTFDSGSDGTTKSSYLGIYASWVKNDGTYFDLIGKYNRFNTRFSTASDRGSYDSSGLGLSVEVGKRFERGKGFFIEPAVELSAMWANKASYTTASGLAVETPASTSLLLRLGFTAGRKWQGTGGTSRQFYGKVSWINEYNGNSTTRVDGAAFDSSLKGHQWVAGVGFIVDSINHQLFIDVEKSWGSTVSKDWGVNFGCRWKY